MAGNESGHASTLAEAVRDSLLRASRYNRSDMVGPAAILWTDADAQWQSLVAELRPLMPELLTLGKYDPEQKTGPAIWLRCVVERALPEVEMPEGVTPVICMPSVGRQTLRAGEECPDSLKPMVELQYRGTVWTQRNGRDWTVEAFMMSEDGGLGLDVARDRQTRQAMLGALKRLAITPIAQLRGKRLEAEDFDKLMIGDPARDLLLWLSDPEKTRKEWDKGTWSAFCSRCQAGYGFDPEKDGEIVGGEKLGKRDGATWEQVWQRYADSPWLYSGIPYLLARAKPSGELLFIRETWPDENDKDEVALRAELLALESMTPADARKTIEELEKRHGARRSWVWTRLELSPLAEALQHLVKLAHQTASGLGGDTPKAMADLYCAGAYLADDAALGAMACVKTAEDTRAVVAALRSAYLPWLDNAARHFQGLVATNPLPDCADRSQSSVSGEPGQCLLFVDGLRFDIAQRLIAIAEERQIHVARGWRWAALPTVTATTKPAVSPVADQLSGHELTEDFSPELAASNQSLTTDRLRQTLASSGYQVLEPDETGKPRQTDARGWSEFGEFDKLGHALQGKLAARIDEQLELLLERIQSLLNAGWKQVRVITDHGWLLVPGGLPVVKLPKYLTESRWPRCAVIKEGSHVECPTASWHWNTDECFAFPPGVCCFVKGNEYAHGGVSLQECLIPDLTFTSDVAAALIAAEVTELQWLGMRCRAFVASGGTRVLADLRTKPNDSESSITFPKGPKEVDSEGRVGLLVKDDSLAGTVVSLVLLDASGRVIGKRTTTVGGDE